MDSISDSRRLTSLSHTRPFVKGLELCTENIDAALLFVVACLRDSSESDSLVEEIRIQLKNGAVEKKRLS